MTLPVVNLDDRRFQDIVDEAKRRIPRHCPQWTDHNVSDPGVALIELFAWMTEMTLYRLNQVPDRLYVKFLELVGIELFTAVPAQADLLFMLSAPQDDVVRVPAGTQVSTVGDEDPVVFLTDEELRAVPPRLTSILVGDESRDGLQDRLEDLRREAAPLQLFPGPVPEDAFYLGFADGLPGNLLRLDITASAEGAGVDPSRPPLQWEASAGGDWLPVQLREDTTAAFNRPGQVSLLLPARHEQAVVASRRAHWLRCRLVQPEPGQPTYDKAPVLETLHAVTLGVAGSAHHAERAPAEHLGVSDGTPGQVFSLRRRPVLPRRPGEVVRVVPPPRGPVEDAVDHRDWDEVGDFSDAGPDDEVVTWDGATGEIRFGPRVVDREGRVLQHGAVPPADAQISVTGYRYGGGQRGNVAAGRLQELRTTLPFVAGVTNPQPASGGVDAESIENAKARAPLTLRSGDRAVTGADVEQITLDRVRRVARARCLPPDSPGGPARLLVVPRLDTPTDRLSLDDLAVPSELEADIIRELEPRRLLTMRIQVGTPLYQGVKVVAEVRGAPGLRHETVRERALRALYAFVNPLTGGPDGRGWPFDQDLSTYEIQGVLRSVPGVQDVTAVHFLTVDLRHPHDPRRVDQRVRLLPEALFLSYEHWVEVRS